MTPEVFSERWQCQTNLIEQCKKERSFQIFSRTSNFVINHKERTKASDQPKIAFWMFCCSSIEVASWNLCCSLQRWLVLKLTNVPFGGYKTVVSKNLEMSAQYGKQTTKAPLKKDPSSVPFSRGFFCLCHFLAFLSPYVSMENLLGGPFGSWGEWSILL